MSSTLFAEVLKMMGSMVALRIRPKERMKGQVPGGHGRFGLG
jgi:hypothetical protein